MENKALKRTVLYHKFFIYLPAILLICLISLIFVSYWINNISFLLINYYPPEIKNLNLYPFAVSSTPKTSFTKDVILGSFSFLFLVLLLIA